MGVHGIAEALWWQGPGRLVARRQAGIFTGYAERLECVGRCDRAQRVKNCVELLITEYLEVHEL